MIRLNIIFILLTSLAFYSCINKGCKRIKFSKEDRRWMKNYSEGDTIVFLSNKSKKHVFISSENNPYFSKCNRFEIGDYQYEEWGVELTPIEGTNKDNVIWTSFSKSLQRNSETPCSKSFQVFDLIAEDVKDLALHADTIILSNSQNYPCYHFYFGDPDHVTQYPDPSNLIVDGFYWSKTLGLLRYELVSGEKFDVQLGNGRVSK